MDQLNDERQGLFSYDSFPTINDHYTTCSYHASTPE